MANDIIGIVVTDNSDNVQINATPNLVSINVTNTSGNIIGSNYYLSSTFSALPAIGDLTILYLVSDTNKIYRWNGSSYIEVSSSTWGSIGGTLSNQTDLQSALNAKAPLASPTFTGTVSGITKSMVGLSNVDNTTDLLKPISTATQSALNLKYDATNPSSYITLPSLSFVAGSGNYNNTTGVITIPTNNSQLTNGAGYLTSSSATTTYVPYTGATGPVTLGANNITANAFLAGYLNVAASASLITLTLASIPYYTVTGSGGQVFKLPNANTIPNGTQFYFNNNQSSGAIIVNNNSNTLVVSVPSGGYTAVTLLDNTNAAGNWDRHDLSPANVIWSTNTFDYAGSITSATWNGNVIQHNRGGTGQSTYTDGQLLIGNSTGNTLSKATLSAGTGIGIVNGNGSISISTTITQGIVYLLRSTYALMIADGTPTKNTIYTVTTDENKGYIRSTYLWKADGNREWIASTPDN
jgi:hypothetical protein